LYDTAVKTAVACSSDGKPQSFGLAGDRSNTHAVLIAQEFTVK